MRETYPGSYDRIYHFAYMRHAAYLARLRREALPVWVDDTVRVNKFCNVFRILDHGSQFVFKNLIETAPTFQDLAFRAFLYRYTNVPAPWTFFNATRGRYPLIEDLESGALHSCWYTYKVHVGGGIFGSAYKMFVGAENRGMTRLDWVIDLAKQFTGLRYPDKLLGCATSAERITLLRELPRCGNFMAWQINTDLGYSWFIQGDENELSVPGPGTIYGAKCVDPDHKVDYVIEKMMDDDRLPILNIGDVKRKATIADVQNVLCEYGKYERWVATRASATKATYKPKNAVTAPHFPDHWRNK